MKDIKRTYLLGEEWLYYKIYCGVISADRILSSEISELIRELLRNKLISKWFFIRFDNPETHLRLRVQLTDESKITSILKIFNNYFSPLLSQKIVWNIQTDTYVRELERYGVKTMEISEYIFFYQSKSILNLLKANLDEETYFLMILSYINQFITLFDLSDTEKFTFLKDNDNSYKEEFELDKFTKISIDKKYRKLKPRIEGFLIIERLDEKISHLDTSITTLNDEIIEKVCQLKKHGKLDMTLKNFLTSHIHMFVNRAFRSKQRFYELIIYDFLFRQLKSSIKRKEFTLP